MRLPLSYKFTLLFVTSSFFMMSNASSDEFPTVLGWVSTNENRCGGYYLEPAFFTTNDILDENLIKITTGQGPLLYSLHGTSISEGKLTISQNNQQVIADKGYLFRDPETYKLSAVDLTGNVILREPNNLIMAESGHLDFKNKTKYLDNITYRMAIYSKSNPTRYPERNLLVLPRKVYQLSAWGHAKHFSQTDANIVHFTQATYSTCPPTSHAWQIQAKNIELNKTTGRGIAKQAILKVDDIPLLYTPYLNFPIDNRRQTGFLWPVIGTSSQSGASIMTPYYLNLAPNYDDTISPDILTKRGLELSNLFRYLTPINVGELNISILPNDHAFKTFKTNTESQYQNSPPPTDPAEAATNQSELNRLKEASLTRKSFSWQDSSHFNENWSGNVDFSYVSDDYYLIDLNNGINQITPNQLLQQADIHYKQPFWQFGGKIQSYQTLHPLDVPALTNQYSRFPELTLEGNYPDSTTGIDYFMTNNFSHFDIRTNPGGPSKLPMGNRTHVQPGISYPFYRPDFYITPRVQFALTDYSIGHTLNNSTDPTRALPILDINTGLYFDRNLHFWGHDLRQTLEPELYYTYVPYRDQSDLPIFDTTENTLTYDQLFLYNRFSGLDRIGDANQLSVGVTTRFIDEASGLEKIRAGLGQIIYFENRKVTLCYGEECSSTPIDNTNRYNRSPLSGVFSYYLTPQWSATANTIWDPQRKQLDNQSITLQYMQDSLRFINFGYSFVRNNNPPENSSIPPPLEDNSLSQTDISFTWPLMRDWGAVARWTQNWNTRHLQNLLYGLQYDSCCWAVRFVTGRTLTNLDSNNTFQYNTEFYIQFALKGLGNFGSGDPTQLLSSSVAGYPTNFGQDF